MQTAPRRHRLFSIEMHIAHPGDLDLDLDPMSKNNRVLPYMMTNISAKFSKISPSRRT
jgi:hypothetical protein